MYRNLKAVSKIVFGRGAFNQLGDILSGVRQDDHSFIVFLTDRVWKDTRFTDRIPVRRNDELIWLNTDEEPKTGYIDELTGQINAMNKGIPCGVVGIGGGSAMDIAKAVSLMLTNPGSAADYQGWDLIRRPGVYHVCVPTLAGTGSEVSRTTVLIGPDKKLGINSDYTVFDQAVLDPELIADAPRDQWFYTGMDCYIHCVESLNGSFLNMFSQAYGEKSIDLCRDIFLNDPPDKDDKLMMASYFGGMSIAYCQVGVCHALSYGLSFVMGMRHGIGNCIAFNQLKDFYPEGVEEFRRMLEINHIRLPEKIVSTLDDEKVDKMVDVALGLNPLWENALGPDWRRIITRERVRELYLEM